MFTQNKNHFSNTDVWWTCTTIYRNEIQSLRIGNGVSKTSLVWYISCRVPHSFIHLFIHPPLFTVVALSLPPSLRSLPSIEIERERKPSRWDFGNNCFLGLWKGWHDYSIDLSVPRAMPMSPIMNPHEENNQRWMQCMVVSFSEAIAISPVIVEANSNGEFICLTRRHRVGCVIFWVRFVARFMRCGFLPGKGCVTFKFPTRFGGCSFLWSHGHSMFHTNQQWKGLTFATCKSNSDNDWAPAAFLFWWVCTCSRYCGVKQNTHAQK